MCSPKTRVLLCDKSSTEFCTVQDLKFASMISSLSDENLEKVLSIAEEFLKEQERTDDTK